MPIITGRLDGEFNDQIGCITGGTAGVAGGAARGYRYDDPALVGSLDAPNWIPTGSRRMSASRIVYAEDFRPGLFA